MKYRVEIFFASGGYVSFDVIDLDIYNGNGERLRIAISDTEVVYVPMGNVNYYRVIKN